MKALELIDRNWGKVLGQAIAADPLRIAHHLPIS